MYASEQPCRGSAVNAPVSAEDLCADLVVEFADSIRRAFTTGAPVPCAQLGVVIRAVMLTYEFDEEQAQEFVEILVREV